MSKSLGNVVEPCALVHQYGVDYVRYFLVSEIPFGQDGNFAHDLLATKINADLANSYGNLIMRALVLINKYCDGKVPAPETPLTEEDEQLLALAKSKTLTTLQSQLTDLNMKALTETIMAISREGNRYIMHYAPWELAKTDLARTKTVLYVLSEALRLTTIYMQPIIPSSAKRIFDEFGLPEAYRTFASIEDTIPPGISVNPKLTPIFPRLELASVTAAKVVQPKKEKKVKTPKQKAVSLEPNTGAKSE